MWDVRYEATGTYTRSESHEDLYVRRQDATFRWDTTWKDARLTPDQPWGEVTPVAVDGTGADEGVSLEVPFGCNGRLSAQGGIGAPPYGGIVSNPHRGGVQLQLVPFSRPPVRRGPAAGPDRPAHHRRGAAVRQVMPRRRDAQQRDRRLQPRRDPSTGR